MTLRWRPMEPDDFDVCDNVAPVSEYRRLVTVMAARKLPGVTMVADGRPVAVIGVLLARDGGRAIVKLWAFLSPLALQHHARALARGLRRRLDKLRAAVAAIEIWVDPAQPRALLLARFLGFDFAEELADPDNRGRAIWRMEWTR